MNEKLKSLAKRSQGYSNPGPLGKAWQESFKSELATAGAVIHPLTYAKSVKYIINFYFKFENTRELHLRLPQSFNHPWISCYSMKTNDVNIKLARILTRNVMVVVNSIYFQLNMIKFQKNIKNPKTEKSN